MTRIEDAFARLKARREKALIPYVCGGDPDLQTSITIAQTVEKYADIVELGIPCRNPVADGLTIRNAMARALAAGTHVEDVFQIASALEKPVVLVAYYQLISEYGLEKFCRDAKRHHVQGIIIPDASAEDLKTALENRHGLDIILLVSPRDEDRRIQWITQHSSGFIYVMSTVGGTGERERLSGDAKELVARVRKWTAKPLVLGFGISTPDLVRTALRCGVDGVAVGSALVRRIEENLRDPDAMLRCLDDFCRELKVAVASSAKDR